MRVEISDDTRSAHSGDVVDYTVRVENDSSTSYPALEVYHLVPAGFQLVDSSPHADQEDSTLRWTADVPAGRTLVFSDQVMAGTVEESEHLAPQSAGRQARLRRRPRDASVDVDGLRQELRHRPGPGLRHRARAADRRPERASPGSPGSRRSTGSRGCWGSG